MRVFQAMTSPAKTISPKATVVEANDLMWRLRIHHLVVTSDQGAILGVITDTDLGGDGAQEIPDQQRVEEVMSRDVITVEPTTDLKRVGALFQERHIHCLPVVEHGRLVGIITSTDLQRIMKQGVPQHTAYHGSTRPS